MRQRTAGRVSPQFRGHPIRAALVVCFVVALGLLFFGRGGGSALDGMRSVTDNATAGLYALTGPPIATGRKFIGNAFHIFDVYRENDRLRAENAKLKAWRAQALALQQKVGRYQALLELPLAPDVQFRTGRVIDDPGGPFVRTFRVDLGRKDGVVEGQAVTDTDGLIGRIVSAGPHASRILLITDLNSRVPVTVEPTDVRGMLMGQNDSNPVVAYLPKDSRIQVGNRVVTSGSGGVFPPNVPVGVVTSVGADHVTIKPAAAFGSIMYVRVIDYAPQDADVPYATSGPPILNETPPDASQMKKPATVSTTSTHEAPKPPVVESAPPKREVAASPPRSPAPSPARERVVAEPTRATPPAPTHSIAPAPPTSTPQDITQVALPAPSASSGAGGETE